MKTIKFHYTLGTKVTLKEMYSIFWKNREYDFFRNLNQMEKPQSFEGYEMPYDLPWETQNSPLLYRHIVAEQLYAKGEKWSYGFPHDYFHVGLLLKLAKLWMNPLVWDYDYFYQKIVVEGRVAKEKYTPEREKSVRQMISAQQVQNILDFVDESPICKEEDPLHGSIKGLHYWTVLTWNLDPLFEKVLDGKDYSEEEITQAKSYDAAYLRKNLSIVAAYRSGKRAAKLLRDFREEWKQIKIWQSESSNMSEKDMQQFEITLFHGFDDLLEEWEAGNDAQKEQPKTIKRAKNQSVSKSQSFETLLQCPQDQKDHVMSRLHELLDNKGGKHVAMILMAAKQKYFLLLDIPTEKQYTAEFTLNGTWRAVSDYIQKHTLPSGKYSEDLDHISIL